jgi:hypothetical protein
MARYGFDGGNEKWRTKFGRGDAHIDIRCPQNESLQNYFQAATRASAAFPLTRPSTALADLERRGLHFREREKAAESRERRRVRATDATLALRQRKLMILKHVALRSFDDCLSKLRPTR